MKAEQGRARARGVLVWRGREFFFPLPTAHGARLTKWERGGESHANAMRRGWEREREKAKGQDGREEGGGGRGHFQIHAL